MQSCWCTPDAYSSFNSVVIRSSLNSVVTQLCGDLDEVERILEQRPQTATEPGGPQRRRHLSRHEKLWTPLLHLCYGRLPLPAAGDNAEAIARALLDHGADPNDYFEVGSHPCRYTALCGVAGEGEDDAPPHPQREALAQLLFERGAEPYDIQVIYNIHFHGNVLWFLELMYEFSTKVGRQADWSDPEWSMIGMGGFGSGARWHLDIAVKKNDLKLAEWVLAHGASPNAGAAPDSRLSQRPIYEEALRNGFTEMALMLKRYGATPSARVVLEGVEAFTAACFRLDREDALAQIAAHPEYLLSPAPMFAAARRDRADVVEFLIDLGMSIEVEDEHKQRPLHEAASHDSLRVAQLLIERGAEKEPVETNWNNTPLDHALYGNLSRMADFLSSFSRDVYRLTWIGNIDRLREVQTEEPDLAKAAADNNTPLMWIPEDEARAIEIVHMLVAGGADPKIRNKEGLTAADCAERRGLYEVADLLRSMERAQTMKPSDDPVWRDAVRGLERGDFSRLEPLFDKHPAFEGDKCRIVDWYEKGYFDHEPSTLAEALTCASFLGRTSIVDLLLTQGVDSAAGTGTGMSALHWAANRGNLDAVRLFIERKAPLELLNMYGGTVLSCTVWSAIHEARADHVAIIEALIDAGANIDASGYPTGNERVDEVLRRRGAK